ncbi:diacylglycerol kinase [Rhizobium sp. NFR12]|uniref:diacylglycerol kinase n=1 Tax=Rhizobium sp. NFR12 TaxID=1566261 RepID=UPI0008A8061E|nr:diacylglycerol kinase [Rhizobium sp. NFR12]SEH22883.1 diacylglycerol kinase (ATP) [Rhizobium sp. NFR12]
MEKTPLDSNIEKAATFRRIIASFRYSMQGFSRLWLEAAFRQEVYAFLIGIVIFAVAGAGFADYFIYVILMLVLFCVEALNTAIEELVDRVSPEISVVGRHAKDLGSFAVFCLLCANGLFALYVVVRQIWMSA